MQSILTDAHEKIKRMGGQQTRREAPAVSSPAKKKTVADPVSQLTDSARRTYNTILDKYGKDAADDFAKGMTGGE